MRWLDLCGQSENSLWSQKHQILPLALASQTPVLVGRCPAGLRDFPATAHLIQVKDLQDCGPAGLEFVGMEQKNTIITVHLVMDLFNRPHQAVFLSCLIFLK